MWPNNPAYEEIMNAMSATAAYSYSDHTEPYNKDFSVYGTIKKLSESNDEKVEIVNETPEEYGRSLKLSESLLKIINEAGNEQSWPEAEKFEIPEKITEALEIALYSILEIEDKKDNIMKYYNIARKDLLGEKYTIEA